MMEDRIDERGNVIRFEGFPKEGFTFLKALKRHNRRESHSANQRSQSLSEDASHSVSPEEARDEDRAAAQRSSQ